MQTLCACRAKMVLMAGVSSNVLSALPLQHTSSLAQRTIFYHFLPVKIVWIVLFYYLFVDLRSQIAFSSTCWPRPVHFSLLPSSLFSSAHIWCCCSPHCPKTLESARILVQPCEKLPSSQLLPIFCESYPSLPFISGPHLPQFIFQQICAIIASSTGCVHGLPMRLWLPFSGCIYFSFLVLPQLSPCEDFCVPQFIWAWGFPPVVDTVCSFLPTYFSLCLKYHHFHPWQSSSSSTSTDPHYSLSKADFFKSSHQFDGWHCCKKGNISTSLITAFSPSH